MSTMYQPGQVAHEAAEMTDYKVALLGISETRWTQTGQRRIPTRELLLFSGHEEDDASHTEGVPFSSTDRMGSGRMRSTAGWAIGKMDAMCPVCD